MGASEPRGAPPQPSERPELRPVPRVVPGYDREHPTIDMQRDVDRLTFFSDAVFAIAITLLALGLVLPAHAHDLGAALRSLGPRYVSFAVTFLVIGTYWTAHHALFAVIARLDRHLIWLNLLLLMSVVVMPFTTSVLAEYGDQPLSVVVYAGSIATTGVLSTLLAWYAVGDGRLTAQGFEPRIGRYMVWRGLIVPFVFLASLPLAWVSTNAATLAWLSIVPLNLLLQRRVRRPSPR